MPVSLGGSGPSRCVTSRPVAQAPLNEIHHRVSSSGDIVVLVTDAQETTTYSLSSTRSADCMGTIVPESKHRSTRLPRGGVAMMLKLLGVAVLIVVEHGYSRLKHRAVGARNGTGIARQHPVVPALPIAVVCSRTDPAELIAQRLVEPKDAAVVGRASAGVPSPIVRYIGTCTRSEDRRSIPVCRDEKHGPALRAPGGHMACG